MGEEGGCGGRAAWPAPARSRRLGGRRPGPRACPGMPVGLTVRRTGESMTASSRNIQSTASAVIAAPAASLTRTASSAGRRVAGSGGRAVVRTASRTRPSSRAVVIRASQSSRSAVARWFSASCSALAIVRASSSSVSDRDAAATTARRSRRRSSLPAAWARRRPVLPRGQVHRRQELFRDGDDGVGVRLLLRDRLTDRRHPAAQQLLGHGELLGPQPGQQGVAMRRRLRRLALLPRRRTGRTAWAPWTAPTRESHDHEAYPDRGRHHGRGGRPGHERHHDPGGVAITVATWARGHGCRDDRRRHRAGRPRAERHRHVRAVAAVRR